MHKKRIYIAFILLTCIGSGLLGSGICEALTPKQAYFNAESCYKKLRNAPAKMKYRENWLRCIEKFQTVYRLDSTGPWAPAGLFMSGKLYKELAKRSWKASDQQEARDIFERIIKRYPNSKYRSKAAADAAVESRIGFVYFKDLREPIGLGRTRTAVIVPSSTNRGMASIADAEVILQIDKIADFFRRHRGRRQSFADSQTFDLIHE